MLLTLSLFTWQVTREAIVQSHLKGHNLLKRQYATQKRRDCIHSALWGN